MKGFEPLNVGIKNQCLTAWRHSSAMCFSELNGISNQQDQLPFNPIKCKIERFLKSFYNLYRLSSTHTCPL